MYVTGGQRKQNNEEFHNLYSTSNIKRKIKSRSTSWAGHVTLIRGIKNLKGIYERLILKQIT
jgi:hypothetical protein